MRVRLFLTTFIAVLIASLSFALLTVAWVRSQRFESFDEEIREAARSLKKSDLATVSVGEFNLFNDIILNAVGSGGIGKVFILRDKYGKLLFQTRGAKSLAIEFPIEPVWNSLTLGPHFVRVLNVDLPNSDGRILQIGVPLAMKNSPWSILISQYHWFILVSLGLAFLVSTVATITILRPPRLLTTHLGLLSRDLKELKDLPPLPDRLAQYKSSFGHESDEFAQLLEVVDMLVERINSSHKLLRTVSARMAHEMITPLTVLKAGIEARNLAKLDPPSDSDLIHEIDYMASTLSEFLFWTELEHSGAKGDLHAFGAAQSLENICRRLQLVEPGRLNLRVRRDFTVIASPFHFDQVISNLVKNALKYSPPETQVEILVTEFQITVSDQGGGFDSHVFNNLGQPFNRGHRRGGARSSSTGLGLAIVMSIAKHYGWNIQFSRDQRTNVKVSFSGSPFADETLLKSYESKKDRNTLGV